MPLRDRNRILETIVDGVFLFTPESYEPEIVRAVKAWFAKTGRHALVTGPMVPPTSKATASKNELLQSKDAKAVVDFLEGTVERKGVGAMVYVRVLL